jgi:hypothetical protein
MAEDPEKAALAFAHENEKMAESQVKALKDEEAKLRARLRKIEAGIQRWENLLEALKQSQGVAGVSARSRASGGEDRRPMLRDRRESEPASPPESRKSLRPKTDPRDPSDEPTEVRSELE